MDKGNNIVLKESAHQDCITTLNIYAPNNRASKYTRQKTDRTARRYRCIQSYSQGFLYPSFNI